MTDRIASNCIRIQSHDCVDESIKIFSNVSSSHRLPRETVDDFTWPKDAIVVVKNLSEQECLVTLEMLRTDSEYIVIRSSRGGGREIKSGDKWELKLRGGEAWTLRSCDATSPVAGASI